MSRKSKFKNFLINGEGPNDQDIFKNRLYQLMGYIDLDEKGYFKKQDLVDFVGFEGPIVEDIWSYFIEDQDNSMQQKLKILIRDRFELDHSIIESQ